MGGKAGRELRRLSRLLRAKALGGRRSPQLLPIKLLRLIALEGPRLQAPRWQRSGDFLEKAGREGGSPALRPLHRGQRSLVNYSADILVCPSAVFSRLLFSVGPSQGAELGFFPYWPHLWLRRRKR